MRLPTETRTQASPDQEESSTPSYTSSENSSFENSQEIQYHPKDQDDPFKDADIFDQDDPFSPTDPSIKEDPFKQDNPFDRESFFQFDAASTENVPEQENPFEVDPFGGSDPFKQTDPFSSNPQFQIGSDSPEEGFEQGTASSVDQPDPWGQQAELKDLVPEESFGSDRFKPEAEISIEVLAFSAKPLEKYFEKTHKKKVCIKYIACINGEFEPL